MAKAKEVAPRQGLVRTCHLCERSLDIRVWYTKVAEEHKRKADLKHRVYACPVCYFSLDEDERKEYYRERV